MPTMTSVPVLLLEGHWLGHLCGPGPWIDVKQFRSDGTLSVDETVEALLAEPEYRDHYCSPENESAGGPLHGPYWADKIKSSDFLPVSLTECESTLHRWREQMCGSEADPEADAVLDRALALVRAAADRRYLRDLREEAEHDWGWVLGFGGFHEFLLVLPDGEVALLVASDD